MDNNNYTSPILASIFRGFGWINIIGGIAVLVLGLADNGPHNHTGGPAALALFGCLASALIFFGIGQVIDYIGQIAHYTRLGFEQGQRQVVNIDGWNKNFLAAMEATSINTKKMLAPPVAPKTPPPPVPASAGIPAARFYYLNLDSQPTGPVPTSELKQLFLDGTLEPDSLVCPEGSDQWKKLEESISL